MTTEKKRLDELLLARGLVADLQEARALIAAGQVLAAERVADKCGHKYALDCPLRLRKRLGYVSRGGLKLEKALSHFSINPHGWRCLDIGASTGGFTDCLLQHGAARVYAVDVAYGQLDWKLRGDHRVVVMERVNARHLKPGDIAKEIDLAVLDASFISLTRLIPALSPFFHGLRRLIVLVKPQFELAAAQVAAGGVVRDEGLRREAVAKVAHFAASLGLRDLGAVASPILGPKGNQEFLLYLTDSPVADARASE
ncbi:MAG: TlyA family RNA methyltransferase [Desulfobulbaceae bacterium]|nr:TlyA family RNA methyltransferase [Desulfobulbaceae bacterium]